jgi:hypothetical protein
MLVTAPVLALQYAHAFKQLTLRSLRYGRLLLSEPPYGYGETEALA